MRGNGNITRRVRTAAWDIRRQKHFGSRSLLHPHRGGAADPRGRQGQALSGACGDLDRRSGLLADTESGAKEKTKQLGRDENVV